MEIKIKLERVKKKKNYTLKNILEFCGKKINYLSFQLNIIDASWMFKNTYF